MSGKSRYRPWAKRNLSKEMKAQRIEKFLQPFMAEVNDLQAQKDSEMSLMGFVSPITKKKMEDLKKRIEIARDKELSK